MADVPVIAVDGPSGTGKGMLCGYLATWLGWHLLDSGALYRVLAHAALKEKIALHAEAGLARLASQLDVRFEQHGRETRVLLADTDVSEAIRMEHCGSAASRVAALNRVRQALLETQRAFRRAPGLVADGRDMGTVVFPEAPLKLFLTASAEERAKRRYKQLKEKGINVSLPNLTADINERDARDESRIISPLRPAPDAIVIDSTEYDAGEVCRYVSGLVRDKFSGKIALPPE
ncbi:MAG: (d)CMP kinase [Gammaproteobacteria bacterium]